MSAEARALLEALIDKIERQPDRVRRVQERAPESFASAEDRASFTSVLKDAATCGAVEPVWGKGDARHLLERVILKDPAALYRFLGRRPAAELASEAGAALRAGTRPATEEAQSAVEALASGWRSQARPFGFGREDLASAIRFIAILDAIFQRDPADRSDMRTFSRLKTGNSKSIESHAHAVADFARRRGLVAPDLGDDDVLKALGLEKFPQPVLISGPISVRGVDFSALLYAGIAPEDAGEIRPSALWRSILTIENFATFNRHVREARRPGDVILYTGGFPSQAVLAALAALARHEVAIRHWGDIDEGGIGIALHLCRKLPVPVLPHLMSPEIARIRGMPAPPVRLPRGIVPSAWRELAEFLTGPECHLLEQEEIDPEPVRTSEATAL